MVMSIDRYLAVVHPIKSTKWRKPRVAKLINLTVWGVSLIVILPTMIFSGLNKVPVCGIIWPEPEDVYDKTFIFYTFFVGFFLPLSVICLCYLLIIIKVSLSMICAVIYSNVSNVRSRLFYNMTSDEDFGL